MLSPFSPFRQATEEYVVRTTDTAPLGGLLALDVLSLTPRLPNLWSTSSMVPTGKEATDFVHACEAIHALLAIRPLAPNERDLIEFIGSQLLVKLRFD